MANEDPVPNMDIRMSFLTLKSGAFAACTTAPAECDMKSGGDVVAAKGFPEVRVWPSVLMTTTGPVVWERAVVMSAGSKGEPIEIVRLAWAGKDEDGRIRATTLWPRSIADSRTRRPVRPVAPIRRMSGRLVVLSFDMMNDQKVNKSIFRSFWISTGDSLLIDLDKVDGVFGG